MAKSTSLLCDRISDVALPGAGVTTLEQHDIDIPEGYLAEIWGCEYTVSGLLDTGGVIEAFCSLDEDVATHEVARGSDDVIFVYQGETLLVTQGGGMEKATDRVFFPHPFLTAHSIIQWVVYSATDWSAARGSAAIFYKLRKATKEDIVELLLRRR